MTVAPPDPVYRRRRGTTRLRVAGFWAVFVLSGAIGIKLIDRVVGASTALVDGALGVSPKYRVR